MATWFPWLVCSAGVAMLGGLLYAWTVPGNDWLVFTIFPMMGAPYILGVAALAAMLGELWRVAVRYLTAWRA